MLVEQNKYRKAGGWQFVIPAYLQLHSWFWHEQPLSLGLTGLGLVTMPCFH